MAEVLLFHHAPGRTTVDEGLAYARKVGVQERGAADLPTGLV
jgi:hypothetical protein